MQILAFNPMDLDLRNFSVMPPHMQTELVLLAIERGSSVRSLASALHMHDFDVLQLARAQHLHNLPAVGVSVYDETPAPPRPQDKRTDRIEIDGMILSRSQISVLRWIAGGKNGKVSALRANMAEAVDLSVKSLDAALVRLLDTGLISRLRIASKSKPALWSVTAAGMDVVASLQGEAA